MHANFMIIINWCSPQCEKWINCWHDFSSTKMRLCLFSLHYLACAWRWLFAKISMHLIKWLTDRRFFCISTISSKSTTSWFSSNVCDRSCKLASLRRFSCSSFCIFCQQIIELKGDHLRHSFIYINSLPYKIVR